MEFVGNSVLSILVISVVFLYLSIRKREISPLTMLLLAGWFFVFSPVMLQAGVLIGDEMNGRAKELATACSQGHERLSDYDILATTDCIVAKSGRQFWIVYTLYTWGAGIAKYVLAVVFVSVGNWALRKYLDSRLEVKRHLGKR